MNKLKKTIKILFPLLIMCVLSLDAMYAQEFNWSMAFQGSRYDLGTDVVTDSNGNVYSVGLFEYTVDFDPSEEVYNLFELNTDKGNIYCVKFSPSGDLIWAHQVGGTFSLSYSLSNFDQPKLAIDGANNIYITGLYDYRVDFDTDPNNTYFIPNPDLQSSTFRFLCKLDSNGNFIWVKQLFGDDGSSIDDVNIKVESNGNIYISGNFNNTFDFDPGPNTYNLSTNNNYDDIFYLKLDSNGNFIWAKQIGNQTKNDRVEDMNIDDGYLYITGGYRGEADFDPSENDSYLISANGGEDAFIAKYDLMNGDLVWAHSLGVESGIDRGYGIVPDNDGNILATGSFIGTIDFDPSPTDTFTMSSIGAASIYLLKLNEDGEFIWVKNFGAVNGYASGSTERARSLAIDSSNSVYLSGNFISQMDCNPDDNDEFYIINIEGNEDIFILKLNSDGNFEWARSFGSPEKEFPYSIFTDINDDVLLTGTFSGILDFNPNEPGGEVNNPWAFDSFILKLSNGTLSLEEQNSIKSVDILPNPACKYIKVVSELENLEVNIYSVNGKLISKHIIKDSSESILVEHLESGVYFINVISGSERVVKKLIKI